MFAPLVCLQSLQTLVPFATVPLLVQNVVVMFHSDHSWFLEEGLYLPWWWLLKFLPLKNTVPLLLDSTTEFSFWHMFWIMSSDNAKRITIFSPLLSLLFYTHLWEILCLVKTTKCSWSWSHIITDVLSNNVSWCWASSWADD